VRQPIETGVEAEASGPVPAWGWTETSLAVMVLIWGINFAIVKSALASFSPLAFNAIRFTIASLFVLTVLAVRGEIGLPERSDVPRVLALGLLGNVAYQMCFILGLARTQAGHASLILALTPVTIALFSTLTGHEKPGPRTWTGALLSVIGVGLVTGAGLRIQGRSALLGNLTLLGACLTWAFYTVGARPIVARYGSLQATAWTMWVGTVGLILAGVPALLRQDWSAVGAAAWGGLLYSALFAIGLAYLIWYRGVERIGNTRTAIFSNLTPVVAMLAAAHLLAERPGLGSLLGAALTLGGVMIVRTDAAG
jgi:drug/metabolite transporter (DMT)-like permease